MSSLSSTSPAIRSLPPAVLALAEAHAAHAAPLLRTYADLAHAAAWTQLDVLDFAPAAAGSSSGAVETGANAGFAVVRGLRPERTKREVVVPCRIENTLSSAHFTMLFEALDRLDDGPSSDGEALAPTERAHLLLAMLSPDGTVVYYTLARGIVKPVN